MAGELFVAFRVPGEARVRVLAHPETGIALGLDADQATSAAVRLAGLGCRVGVVRAPRDRACQASGQYAMLHAHAA